MQLARARIEVIPANEYRRVRWRNGLGWTREIVRVPDGDAFDWRLSIAEIERDAPFSAFPGVDRELVLLSGNGLRLRFGDGRVQELPPPHGNARFAGEDAVTGELIDGPTTDFNLMWRRDAVAGALWRRPLVGAMVVFVDPHEAWAVHLLSGQARFADGTDAPVLESGDTALLRADGGRSRSVLDGAGEALLIRLTRAGARGP
jgi:environmental stress-induced protein Ves